MNLFVGVTDRKWFDFLRQSRRDEVNFWKPGGTAGFAALEPGGPFLFKLHAPVNKIVGGGFFVKFEQLPIALAWEVFGEKNGAPDFASFRESVLDYRRSGFEENPRIGCIVLASPFFLPESRWIDMPADWAPNIVQGKRYFRDSAAGERLWQWAMANFTPELDEEEHGVAEEHALYGQPRPVRPRLGQGSFRLLVTDAYQRRCAVSGEKTLPALEAAHIRPFNLKGPHRVSNGLLLRADLHKLFDSGFITVTDKYQVEVSRRIKEEYENGREYYKFHGQSLGNLPSLSSDRPAVTFLRWHNSEIYRG